MKDKKFHFGVIVLFGIFLSFTWFSHLRWMLWNPPSYSSLNLDEGYISREVNDVKCKKGSECRYPPYIFHSITGFNYPIYCEPSPYINNCFKSVANDILNEPVKLIKIKYYTENSFDYRRKYRVAMESSIANKIIFSYDDRVQFIRRSADYGHYPSGDLDRRLNSSHRKPAGHWAFWFVHIPILLVLFGFVVFEIVSVITANWRNR